VVPNHALPPQVRLFLLHRRNDAGMDVKVRNMFALLIAAQLLIVVLSTNSAEFAVTIIAIPVVLILLGFCGIAVQREIKWYVP
jgi:Flp pilus assembly protein TadB